MSLNQPGLILMILTWSEWIVLQHSVLSASCVCVCVVTCCCVSWAAVRSCYSSACRPWNLPSDRDLILFPKSDNNLSVPFLQRTRQAKAEGQPLCPHLGPQVHQIQSNFKGFNAGLLMFHINKFRPPVWCCCG